MTKCKYDWSAAESSYINAPDMGRRVSLRDISDQYNIPYQTVRRYAAKYKWVYRRDQIYYDARKLREPQVPQFYRYSTRGMPKNVVAVLQRSQFGR